MKKALIATALCACTLSTSAFAVEYYAQGQLGVAKVEDLTTESGPILAQIKYDDDILFGLEGGISGFEQHNVLRLGLSWQTFDMGVSRALIDDGINPPVVGNEAELEQAGYDLENRLDMYSVKLYYDFPVNMTLKPYIGVGLGIADVEDADQETAYIFNLGGRYPINDQVNVGLKYEYVNVKDLTADNGTAFNGITQHSFSATIDYRF